LVTGGGRGCERLGLIAVVPPGLCAVYPNLARFGRRETRLDGGRADRGWCGQDRAEEFDKLDFDIRHLNPHFPDDVGFIYAKRIAILTEL
jgi:hypothetical protein